jgi:signal transduction histidine kinase
MLALIEIGDATNENLNEIANTALTDLRMVIETLALPEGDLRGALAAFRERCVAPLHYLGVDIEWDLIGLPRIEHLNSEQLLSILRLVQEAITNAMKHGQAKRFAISGWQPDTITGCISITNSGGLPLQDYTPGHGIKSMHKRAAGIGGTLDIVKTYSGAIVNLRIPILR